MSSSCSILLLFQTHSWVEEEVEPQITHFLAVDTGRSCFLNSYSPIAEHVSCGTQNTAARIAKTIVVMICKRRVNWYRNHDDYILLTRFGLCLAKQCELCQNLTQHLILVLPAAISKAPAKMNCNDVRTFIFEIARCRSVRMPWLSKVHSALLTQTII